MTRSLVPHHTTQLQCILVRCNLAKGVVVHASGGESHRVCPFSIHNIAHSFHCNRAVDSRKYGAIVVASLSSGIRNHTVQVVVPIVIRFSSCRHQHSRFAIRLSSGRCHAVIIPSFQNFHSAVVVHSCHRLHTVVILLSQCLQLHPCMLRKPAGMLA